MAHQACEANDDRCRVVKAQEPKLNGIIWTFSINLSAWVDSFAGGIVVGTHTSVHKTKRTRVALSRHCSRLRVLGCRVLPRSFTWELRMQARNQVQRRVNMEGCCMVTFADVS